MDTTLHILLFTSIIGLTSTTGQYMLSNTPKKNPLHIEQDKTCKHLNYRTISKKELSKDKFARVYHLSSGELCTEAS